MFGLVSILRIRLHRQLWLEILVVTLLLLPLLQFYPSPLSIQLVAATEHWPEGLSDIQVFEYYANQPVPVKGMYQDKTTAHRYQEMYGRHLLPMIRDYHNAGKRVKFMEIGLGCNQQGFHYGAGVEIWKALFSARDELWFAEYIAQCLESGTAAGPLRGLNLLQGDQSSQVDLQRWLNTTQGGFDVIVDDGGHQTRQIIVSFYFLFEKALQPGGMYIIEDIDVNGFNPMTLNEEDEEHGIPGGGRLVLLDVINSWTTEIITDGQLVANKNYALRGYGEGVNDVSSRFYDRSFVPLPRGVKSIFCYAQACILLKCDVADASQRCQREQRHQQQQQQQQRAVLTDAQLRLRKWNHWHERKQQWEAAVRSDASET